VIEITQAGVDYLTEMDRIVVTVEGREVSLFELHEAFARVQSKNWKDPVDKAIKSPSAFERGVINEAVIWFTGSAPEFCGAGRGMTRVRAAGYYLTIGA